MRAETITIRPSPTADTRTCDFRTVTKKTLLDSSAQHIRDVQRGLAFFQSMLAEAAIRHDYDKIEDIDGFHADFVTGFEVTDWWERHRRLNRHHLSAPDGEPADVDLIDVLDMIADGVMAGMARSGEYRREPLPDGLLDRALENTITKLLEVVVVSDD